MDAGIDRELTWFSVPEREIMLRKPTLLLSALAVAVLLGGCAADPAPIAPAAPSAQDDTTPAETAPEGSSPDDTTPGEEPPQNVPLPSLTPADVEFRQHGSGATYWQYSYPGVDLVDVERVVDELQAEGLKLHEEILVTGYWQWFFDGPENMVQLSYTTTDGSDVGGDMYYLIWSCAISDQNCG